MDLKIKKDVKQVLEMLNHHGYEAYIVGGCVRDFCLGESPKDFDVTTSATPSEIRDVFVAYPQLLVGMKHGTVSVQIEKEYIEITTFRVDGKYLDSRHPSEVHFTSSLKEDLKRRDFTINAMAMSYDGKIIDYFNGQDDIAQKIIRAVGDPAKRFQEDALRILRGFRFASTLGFHLESATKRAMLQEKELLLQISKERIQVEFSKTLLGKAIDQILVDYIPLLEELFFPLMGMNHAPQVYETLGKKLVESPHDLVIRLTIFCLTLLEEKAAISCLELLKYDRKTIQSVTKLMQEAKQPVLANKIAIKRILKEIGNELFVPLITIERMSDTLGGEYEAILALYHEIIDQKECYSLKDLQIKGQDLEQLGLFQKEVGVMLETLLLAHMEGNVSNERNALVEYAKQLIEREK